jgi:hypothetical protein
MQKKYVANSVSLKYSPSEDRVEWISHINETSYVSAWVSRRFIKKILPKVIQWMADNKQLTPQSEGISKSAIKSQKIVNFQHQAAQSQVKVTKEKLSEKHLEESFLLGSFNIKPLKQGLSVLLADAESSLIVALPMSGAQLHRVLGELIRLAKLADWQIANPLQERQPEQTMIH